jgi:hypothetical protein
MLQALVRTITELLDSKKAAYSFIASIGASFLHLYFGVSVTDSLLLVSPLVAGTVAQAHVDAKKAGSSEAPAAEATADVTITPPAPAPAPAATPADASDGTKA